MQINKIAYSYQSVPNNTIRVSEAYLNRAEAYVLSGQANKNTLALADLNELRRHRIVGYEDVTIADETGYWLRSGRNATWNCVTRDTVGLICVVTGCLLFPMIIRARSSLPWVTYTLREKRSALPLPFPTTVFKNNIQLKQNPSAREPERTGEIKSN